MPTVSESIAAYVSAQNAADDQIEAEVASATTSVTAIAAEITQLQAELAAINNSPGSLSPADQASLDSSLARTTKMATSVQALSDNLTAISAVPTPPAPAVPVTAGLPAATAAAAQSVPPDQSKILNPTQAVTK